MTLCGASASLSRQKIAYLKDLATKVQDGALQLTMLPTHSDAEVMHQLMGVKGIGRWTAEMFLIFALGRLDVFLWTIWAFARPYNVPMATSDYQRR
jgi:3-methyladenine DNA glycosylase/8-oxoguanine DNA glycosylase